ncbi:trehalose-phosphatase [[Candida] railenensis]|uniref:Trehalose-phosphatase n=1 Tax=[Candida] railenensis TaxID=45579 RepID=A0A9P0QMH9_9ASCO|nr:trehalose-phosphatase [[Candida] railenensis]
MTVPTFKMVSPKDFQANENMKLSGRVINVMTMLPTQIVKTTGDDNQDTWSVQPVTGNSALYSSQQFLDQNTDWETHLVGWTGEVVNKTKSFVSSSFATPNVNPSSITAENIQDDPLYLDDQDKIEIEDKIRVASGSEFVHPVWLLRRDQERWRKYAENVIWPVFHYIQGQATDGKDELNWWYDYVKFNELYFQKISSIYKPGDIIWIHDYYLLLLPQLIRMAFPDAYIGLFVHAPFPSSEYFRCLSKRTQLLDGMLGADRIVFQSESFQRHFRSCCARLLGCEVKDNKIFAYGSYISLETLPIGIDTEKIEHSAFSKTSGIDDKIKALKQSYQDQKIIVGRDRLDTVRGVVQKLQAFEMFLQMYPEWRSKVVLIQVSSPGYSHSAKVAKKVSEMVNHINSEYGTLNHTPVLHYQMRIEKEEYLALLRVADLALVTSVRDGMNTTSLEYVICQKYTNAPLILSEFTGTASVLSDAILVNPWDSVGIARTINDCLLMPTDEKKLLEAKLYKQVTSNTIQNWTSNFLKHLLQQVSTTHQSNYTPALNRPLLLKNYKQAKRRLFLFDYDGTLSPIVKDPAAAIPSSKLNKVLDKLCEDPKNQFWIISGRDQVFLDKWFGKKNMGLSAEHGCFMRDVGSKEWVNLAESFDMSWQKEVENVFEYYTERTPNSNIERKKVALTWHFRRADPELGEYQAERCFKQLMDEIAPKYDVEIMEGKANIEVRPKFVNKGEIAKRLALSRHGDAQEPNPIVIKEEMGIPNEELPDFILCLGDDRTDEDMFRSLKEIEVKWQLNGKSKNEFGSFGVYPVAVGPASKETIATSHLNDPASVIETLGLLAGTVSLFESAGSVDLDDRGHVKNSVSSRKANDAIKAATALKKIRSRTE